MFNNDAQLTDEEWDYEPSKPKRQKPMSSHDSTHPDAAILNCQHLSQPVKPLEGRNLDNRKDFHLAATQIYPATVSGVSGFQRCTDEFNAFSVLQREAGLDNAAAVKGYYTLTQIQKSIEENSLPRDKVPVTICSIVSYSVKSSHGDAVITVRDRSGVISACIQRSLLRTLQPNVLSIRGAALLLTGVSVMSLRRSNGGLLSFSGNSHSNLYLNVTPKNIVCVYFRPNASTTSTESSCTTSASGNSIRRIFCQPGVSSPTSLAAHVNQYLTSFFDNTLPSVSGVANIPKAVTNGNGIESDDDIDLQAIISVANAFDDGC